VAIKKINVHRTRPAYLINEVMVLKLSDSPNIVSYVDSYLVGKELWIAMEYLAGGSLADLLEKSLLDEGQTAAVCRE
ncbi:PAK1 kinase, partial [Upupa epops]|nr:PAK1 kinase [Upupa epops]NWU92170.1 PAK1 kinase [Upupa epops]